MLWCSVALLALFASVQGRAVNISNTWVLPEEGFPVFYRYFRDRISWYEADAVCQFHHANLVTVDTTGQYDAVRAYLKELDISSAVWVGLIRSNPDGDFTWTDYRGLSGEGYWSSAPDARSAPLCAAADPAADYRWEARACGGPTVASFICELPVPQWALGNEGCMVRALPALTILYLPESAAVQLTADCGLAGVKRVQCTGNVKREDLLKDLSCTEEEEVTTTASVSSSVSTWPVTTDAAFTEQDTTTEVTTEENGTTEHEDDINQSTTVVPSSTIHNINLATEYKIPTKPMTTNTFERINNNLHKNLDLNMAHNNNLQSNYIPKIVHGQNYLFEKDFDKIAEDRHMQHKMLHEEIARIGNLDNIFTQPTDHFVPPLVMAKAKISDDMTVLSLQEKHAQQIAEHHLSEHNKQYNENEHVYKSDIIKSTTEEPNTVTINKILFMQTMKSKDGVKKDKIKTSMPKKYIDKAYDPKNRIQKPVEMKPIVLQKFTEASYTQTESVTKLTETTSLPLVGRLDDEEDTSLDLTVVLKDSPDVNEEKHFYNYSGDISRLEVVKNSTLSNDTEIKFYDLEATEETKHENFSKIFEDLNSNITLNNEVINITIISEETTTAATPTIVEITTKLPMTEEQTSITSLPLLTKKPIDEVTTPVTESVKTSVSSIEKEPVINISINPVVINPKNDTVEVTEAEYTTTVSPIITTTTALPIISTTLANTSEQDKFTNETTTTAHPDSTHDENIGTFNAEAHEDFDMHYNSTDALDDLNSPLLSGANEPIRRPNRSRRPQPPPNRNKFNPFRILG